MQMDYFITNKFKNTFLKDYFLPSFHFLNFGFDYQNTGDIF